MGERLHNEGLIVFSLSIRVVLREGSAGALSDLFDHEIVEVIHPTSELITANLEDARIQAEAVSVEVVNYSRA